MFIDVQEWGGTGDAGGDPTVAANGILGLTSPVQFYAGGAPIRFTFLLDLGAVHLEAGTAGDMIVQGGVFLLPTGSPAPTDSLTKDVEWAPRAVLRSPDGRQTPSLGGGNTAVTLNPSIGIWDLYLGIVVDDVGGLDGETLEGFTPSGVVTLSNPDAPDPLFS